MSSSATAEVPTTTISSAAATPTTAPESVIPTTSMMTQQSSSSTISANLSSGVINSPGLRPSSSTLYSNFPPPPIFSVAEPYTLFRTVPRIPTPPPVVQTPAHTSPPPPPASSYFGSTFSGSPGVIRPAEQSIFGSPMAALAQSVAHITTISQIVTIKLKAVEDYLTWRTQFESFLVSQGLLGIVDGSIEVPPMYTIDFANRQVPNPDYYYWLRVDQTIRCWLFATLTRDVLVDVHDLKHFAAIWTRLQTRFMSASLPRSMELKRLLSTIKKKENQSMELYLREIKNIVDPLAAINSPVSDKELLEYILAGLGPEYKSFVTTVSLFPHQFPFDILQPRLMEEEQKVLSEHQQHLSVGHQAFVAAAAGEQPPANYSTRGRGGRGRAGGRGRTGRGRGRGPPPQYGAPQQLFGAPQPYFGQHPSGGQQSYAGQQGQQLPGGQFVGRQQPGYSSPTYGRPPVPFQGVLSSSSNTTGFPSGEGILGSIPPPVVCQLCFNAGHSALQCPSRFSQPSAPALLANNGESNSALWYPDSGASAHMTPTEGQTLGGGSSAST
ncbi:unnamed protein product [Cuscuta epithymum]|uniref:Retrotransposon gag domain-containing protein n=1 Tax=Cuscuta epithymum TaxID=186058 RepID=A0AAV0EQ22_9ASTE|nr:unnamed protein product [Cuscuta epithymum]